LIAILQSKDPSGNSEVAFELTNGSELVAIKGIGITGRNQIRYEFVKNKSDNIVGGRLFSFTDGVLFQLEELEDSISQDPDFPIEIDIESRKQIIYCKQLINRVRTKVRNSIKSLNISFSKTYWELLLK